MFQSPNVANSLQQVISAATSDGGIDVSPHHPITCHSKLYFNDDNSFGCEHITVPPDDARTQRALNHTIACLIIEEAVRKFHFDGGKE